MKESSEFMAAVHAWATEGFNDDIEADPSVDHMVRLWLDVQDIRRALAQAQEHLRGLVSDVVQDLGGKVDVEGVGTVTIKYRASGEKWESERVLQILVAQAMDERKMDPETGEMLERPEDAVVRVLAECAPITTPSFKWRAVVKDRLGPELVDELRHVDQYLPEPVIVK